MSLRNLRIYALLILAFSVSSYAQSLGQPLGDIARQVRAERQTSTAPHARVITNDDIDRAASVMSADASTDVTQNVSKKEDAGAAQAPSSAEEAKKGTNVDEPKPVQNTKSARKDPTKEREAQELETQARTLEINRIYLDRIAALRQQLKTAEVELAKLQQSQLDSSYAFQRTLGVSPSPGEYEQQQRTFNAQIYTQRNLIGSLNSQLEDAYEAARHAGVPHASN